MFLRDKAPAVLALLEHGLLLATTRCSCEYHDEIKALDTVVIRMRLQQTSQSRLQLRF